MRGLRSIICVAVGLSIAACSQPPVPKDSFYRLQAVEPKQVYDKPLFPGTVEVQRFSADGLMANRPIVYADASRSHHLGTYHYHFWIEPPPTMIRDQFVDYLRASKVAERVITPELRVFSDFVVSGKIKRFEHVRGGEDHAAVELEIAARQSRSGDLLYLGTYGVKKPIAGKDVSSVVAAINEAVRDIFARFLTHIGTKKP